MFSAMSRIGGSLLAGSNNNNKDSQEHMGGTSTFKPLVSTKTGLITYIVISFCHSSPLLIRRCPLFEKFIQPVDIIDVTRVTQREGPSHHNR